LLFEDDLQKQNWDEEENIKETSSEHEAENNSHEGGCSLDP
jgi:hypothetical protein